MVGFQTCGSLSFFFFFVSVPESLAGLDGREQQLQYQALLSFTAGWIPTAELLYADAAAVFVAQGLFSFSALQPNGYSFLLFFELKTKDSSSGSRGRGLKRFACAPMYSLQAGSGPFLLAVLAGLQVSVSPSGDSSIGHFSRCCFFSGDVCRVGSPGEPDASEHFARRAVDPGGVLHPRWVQTGCNCSSYAFASLAALASLCWELLATHN